MKWQAHVYEGWLNLFSSKLRSALALLGILVGTASVVAMVLGGQLATNEAIKQFKQLGTDLLAVSIIPSSENNQSGSAGKQENLTIQDAKNIVTADKKIVDAAAYTLNFETVQFEGHEVNASVIGVSDHFAKIVHIDIDRGRFISMLDGYQYFGVIGKNIADQIKEYSDRDPIGQQIQVGKNFFTIIGVAKPWPENSFIYANIDSAILVPILTSSLLNKNATINNIIMQLTPDANIDVVKNNVTEYVNSVVTQKRLFFRSAKELISRMSKQSEILTVLLGLIGGVSLIVGGIGVMNIMLVSVVERRREIGIRLAVGATRSDIRSLFLVEAVMLTLAGGTLGVISGIVIAYIIALFWHWQFTLFLLPPLIGFSVSVAIGIFFGFYPAHKAAQLDPIVALRSE